MNRLRMLDIYSVAIDPDVDLDVRYLFLKLMEQKRKSDQRNYLKLWKKSQRQRTYNNNRIDWRRCAGVKTI